SPTPEPRRTPTASGVPVVLVASFAMPRPVPTPAAAVAMANASSAPLGANQREATSPVRPPTEAPVSSPPASRASSTSDRTWPWYEALEASHHVPAPYNAPTSVIDVALGPGRRCGA